MTKRQWKQYVKEKVEVKNKIQLYDDCHKKENGEKVPKTKTKHIIQHLDSHAYQREPTSVLLHCTRQETKTIMITRFGMLECGRNFKGTINEQCSSCNQPDDESHRLNHCVKFQENNLFSSNNKVNFHDIYSDNVDVIKSVITHIEKLWNVKTAHGNTYR